MYPLKLLLKDIKYGGELFLFLLLHAAHDEKTHLIQSHLPYYKKSLIWNTLESRIVFSV